MTLVSRDKAAHWYRWLPEENRAEACYEVPYADPTKGMRPTTLADAKKLGLFPSPTSILNVLSKPSLTAWLQEQAILASLTLPREFEPAEQWWGRCVAELGRQAQDGEAVMFWCAKNARRHTDADDAHAHRIVTDMEAQGEKAKSDGTAIHEAIMMMLEGIAPIEAFSLPKHITGILGPIREWIHKNINAVRKVEEIVASPSLKLAGKLDLYAEVIGLGVAFIDFKGQDVKNGKPVFYEEWPLQLAAYQMMCGMDKLSELISVVIDRKTGAVYPKVWPRTDKHWEAFQHCHELWKWRNGYE